MFTQKRINQACDPMMNQNSLASEKRVNEDTGPLCLLPATPTHPTEQWGQGLSQQAMRGSSLT